ncbi:hypothetical protein H4R19_004616, partial [Coemansia spiralis]
MVHFTYAEPADEATVALAQQSLAARDNSHSPYSKFRVGAAVRTADGTVFAGCNIESCAFAPTICAERVAISSAVAAGHRQFAEIAVSSDVVDKPVTPCGVCRQFMREFSKDLPIVLVRPDGTVCHTDLEALLPGSFGPEFLGTAQGANPPRSLNQYYVGYVEDDESVDAIMKKFEELERIEKEFSAKKDAGTDGAGAAPADAPVEASSALPADGDDDGAVAALGAAQAAAGESGMSAELLEEVFKRTSAFTVRGAMMDDFDVEVMDDIELWEAEASDSVLAEWDEEEDYITLHLDDDALDDEFGVVVPRRRYQRLDAGKRSGPKLSNRDQIIQRYKYMEVRIQDRHGHTFFVRRKVNAVDPSMPTYVRIPPRPIPRSWVKHIRLLAADAECTPSTFISGILQPKAEPKWARRIDTEVTLEYDYSTFGRTFQCVYMDPPLL